MGARFARYTMYVTALFKALQNQFSWFSISGTLPFGLRPQWQ